MCVAEVIVVPVVSGGFVSSPGPLDGVVEVQRAGRAVGSAKTGHATSVAHRPSLAGAFHADLKDVAMSALNSAAADGPACFAKRGVAHAVGVVAVVADEVIERRETLGATAAGEHHDAVQQLIDERIGVASREKLLNTLLPQRKPKTVFADQHL